MAIITLALMKRFPRDILGAKEWIAFPFFGFFSSLLFDAQGTLHHYVSIALPNILLVVTLAMFTIGTLKFYASRINYPALGSIIFITSAYFFYSSGKSELFSQRVIFLSATVVLLLFWQVKTLIVNIEGSFGAKLMLATITTMSLVMIMRCYTAWHGDAYGNIFSYSNIQAIYLATFGFGMISLSMSGIFLMLDKFYAEILHLVRHDELTGALSRKAIFDMLSGELARADRGTNICSVLLVDLDFFKKINDEHGHLFGDQVLIEFVKAVKTALRQPSEIGRYGGEEFIVVLPDTSASEAVVVAERLRAAVSRITLLPNITISIGVSSVASNEVTDIQSLIAKADIALYEAKKTGRDKVVVSV